MPADPLTVVALGGNALSPPAGCMSLAAERVAAAAATAELAALARAGTRLLVVHGNGPQVGRLLASPGVGDSSQLDVHVAQTQGELGYLIAHGLDGHLGGTASAVLVTRVVVGEQDPAFQHPSKPIGPTLASPPTDAPAVPVPGGGWRRVVASPRPIAVVEREAIATLLGHCHVIAGGGGGIPLVGPPEARRSVPAVVDKDWVASLLAIALRAERLIFVTDVDAAYDQFDGQAPRRIGTLSPGAARARLAADVFGPGSMAPKIESAADFVEATGRPAVITAPGAIASALCGAAGTTVTA
jgi:carbamate kinase